MINDNPDISAPALVAANNADAILAAAKRLKSAKKKYDALQGGEEGARAQVRELMQKAHDISGAMMNAADNAAVKSLMEDNQRIQKELAKANNKMDAAIDKAREESDAIGIAHQELMDAIEGKAPAAPAAPATSAEPEPQAPEAPQEELATA